MSVAAATSLNNKLSGADLPWGLHAACAAWPEMSPAELSELANDIAEHGLRDPITLTPDGLLLDGRNRALACVMAGVEPTTVTYDGDPWLFSLSRNKQRRHLTTDQIAFVAAKLATRTVGNPKLTIGSVEPIGIAQAAAAAGVPETAIKSAKLVRKHGTVEENKAVESGAKRLRKTADDVRARQRGLAPPSSPKKAKTAKPAADPIDDVVREIVAQCADGEWRTLAQIALRVRRAEDSILKALKALGKLGVAERTTRESKHEYWIAGKGDVALLSEIAKLKAELAGIEAELDRYTAPAKAAAPATVMAN